MVDLQSYMTESIRRIMGNAYRSVLGNPREARFVLRMQQAFHRSERRRRTLTETEGLQVPPFLIASIATACNLQCKGCYARKNGIAAETPTKPTLSPEQWGRIFAEAEKLGVNFCLAAGRGFFHIGPDGSAEPCPFSPYSDTNVARDGLRAALHSPLFTRLRDANTGSWQHTGGCTLYEHRDEVEQMLGIDKGNV